MRLGLVVLLSVFFAAWPTAVGTPATPPFESSVEVHGEPRTGQAVEVEFTLRLNQDFDTSLHVWAPEWVEGDRASWHVVGTEGQTLAHNWTFTAPRDGFWLVGLATDSDPAAAYMGCCSILLYSSVDEGRTGATSLDVLPAADITIDDHVEVENGQAFAVYTVHARSSWMRHGELVVQDHGTPGPTRNTTISFGVPQTVRQEIDLPAGGNGVVTFHTIWRHPMPDAGLLALPLEAELDCTNVSALVEGERVRDDGSWSCHVRPAETGRFGGVEIPAIPTTLLLAGLALMLGVLRRQ